MGGGRWPPALWHGLAGACSGSAPAGSCGPHLIREGSLRVSPPRWDRAGWLPLHGQRARVLGPHAWHMLGTQFLSATLAAGTWILFVEEQETLEWVLGPPQDRRLGGRKQRSGGGSGGGQHSDWAVPALLPSLPGKCPAPPLAQRQSLKMQHCWQSVAADISAGLASFRTF